MSRTPWRNWGKGSDQTPAPLETDALNEATRKYLARRQATAASYVPRSDAIDMAWKAFGKTQARKEVARALDAYTHTKCAYCEMVAAKDIEHFYPKTDFPARMFLWTNFLAVARTATMPSEIGFRSAATSLS